VHEYLTSSELESTIQDKDVIDLVEKLERRLVLNDKVKRGQIDRLLAKQIR